MSITDKLRKAHKEYEKARDFVEDIVLSFDRELKRESDRFESMTFKVEGSSPQADASFRKMESLEKKIAPFEEKLGALNKSYQANVTVNLTSPHRKHSKQNNNPI